jgi:G3E family GTPase
VSAIASVPAVIVTAGTHASQAAAIEALLDARPASERWAVLAASRVMAGDTVPAIASRAGVVVHEAPFGCACCIGNVTFRVTLTRLLRESRPARLIVQLAPEDHAERAIAALGMDPWLAAAVRVAEIVRAS